MASDILEARTLSDEQIEQLIQEAETRAIEKAKSLVVAENLVEDELSLRHSIPDTRKRKPIPRLQHGLESRSYIEEQNGVARVKHELLATKEQRSLAETLKKAETPHKSSKKTEPTDAGDKWFNLPRTKLTPALKRDFQLIAMRSVLDPHRHYKKNSSKSKIPEFSQTGTVIEGPTEFFSSRINRKDRSKNFVEEAIATERENGRFKRKYNEIQEKKTSGKKAHYKALMKKRRKT